MLNAFKPDLVGQKMHADESSRLHRVSRPNAVEHSNIIKASVSANRRPTQNSDLWPGDKTSDNR
ncbi:MAG: hypothetical protein KIT31_32955 [Deltaproteobacteria bacterium]|nr:hypothetical protein [Deltaproteobacteria bacterium]